MIYRLFASGIQGGRETGVLLYPNIENLVLWA